jgi:hypothetical protein
MKLTSFQLQNSVHSVHLLQYEKKKVELQNQINMLYGKVIREQEDSRKRFCIALQSLLTHLDIKVTESSGYFTGHVINIPENVYSGIKSRELFSFNSNKNYIQVYLWRKDLPQCKVIKFTKDTDINKIVRYVLKFGKAQLKLAGKI